ncbi:MULTISPECIES: hypothetical protein [Calothrix]|uniref:Uncharacterized protein n=2 Tax=Calothrix TaxID=1186 RepID=A0ABR8A5G2_9CYAN|nr:MULTISPECIES: hypothetical protein [Calothrix]MBD2195215.1 hypothetical protein [Calothrix parietina FACHB-288]MBD2223814.1 hypothetical protein [Calothrix anomala FACHB-343]
MSEHLPDESIENIEPPEVKLTVPQLSDATSAISETLEKLEIPEAPEIEKTWLVVAKNRRILRDWEALMQRHPENTHRCYRDLCTAPTTRQPGRVFPLKGKKYQGVWEYEVTKGDRVFDVPDEEQMKVVVFYAGKHIQPAPTP